MGGAEKVVIALTRGAEARGWKALCLNPFDSSPDASALASSLGPGLYQARALPPRRLYAARRWLDSRLTEVKPNIVQAQLIHAMMILATSQQGSRSWRVVSHQHGDHFQANGLRLKAWVDRWSTRRFDRVVAVSDHVRRFLVGTYGIPSSAIATISNGWDGSPLRRGGNAAPTVVCVGNLRPEKGHDILLKAFTKVVRRFPNAHLLLVGDGPSRAHVERWISELDLRKNVEMAGAVEEVWPFLARGDVAALPSFNETSGIAAMEAMGAGLPVVASNVGGLPELVEHGHTGHLVAPRDPEELADALLDLLTDPEKARRWGERGRELAVGRQTSKMVDAYYDLFESLPPR